LKPGPVARVYVIDSGVALYGGANPDLFAPEERPFAVASSLFLSRAAFHGAELHVPGIFYSEVMALVWHNFVKNGVVSRDDATTLLEDVLGTDWQMHIAVFGDVLRLQDDLEHLDSTADAEYLAVASGLSCQLVTADEALIEEARTLDVSVILVTAHPWSTPGALEDDPPDG
jgi:predicted nucleic acid-binding protein